MWLIIGGIFSLASSATALKPSVDASIRRATDQIRTPNELLDDPIYPSRRAIFGSSVAALVAARAFPALGSEPLVAGSSLRSRIDDKDAYPPPCRVEAPDVYYPPWMAGTWAADSTTLSVEAPSGVGLFGGNRSYAAAQADIGVTLRYKARFRPVPFNNPSVSSSSTTTAPVSTASSLANSGLLAVNGGVVPGDAKNQLNTETAPASVSPTQAIVADREFNTGAIAKAALGEGAVRGFTSGRDASRSGGSGGGFVSDSAAGGSGGGGSSMGGTSRGSSGVGDNEAEAAAIAFVLAPNGADGAMFRAELTTTQRRVEVEDLADSTEFAVLETVRQVVTAVSANGIGGPPTGGAAAQPPLIKEVETTCLYNLPKGLGAPNSNGKPLQFEALQRTATYLRPSNQGDPYLAAAVARLGGRAVDIRTYRIVYTLVRPPGTATAPSA